MSAAETPGNVSFLGLGTMGSALAEALLEHVHAVTVWNRSSDRAPALVDQGAVLAQSVEEAIEASPVTVVCVLDHAATMAILVGNGARRAAEGRTIVQLSTMTSDESRELAEWADACGARYLDGQILSYPDDVRSGRGWIVCSGPSDLCAEHAALLKAAAGNVLHAGESNGAAPAFDKAHLSFALGYYLSFLHGAAMCARSGVDLRTWCDYNLRHMASGAVPRQLSILADQVCGRSYDAGMDATIDVWRGALQKVLAECDASGTDRAHLIAVADLMAHAVSTDRGSKELGALYESILAASG